MNLSVSLVAQLDLEAPLTRRLLQRIPSDALDWRPSPCSGTLREIGSHVAGLPGRFLVPLALEEGLKSPDLLWSSGVDAMLTRLDTDVIRARQVLQGMDDAHLLSPWRYMDGGTIVFELPRLVVAQSMGLNHMVHHRGQLTVYLRMLSVPIPALYGPSGDES